MKLHEFLKEINLIHLNKPEVLNMDIVIHETILGFMHNITNIEITIEPETKKEVVAIQYRGE